MDTAEKTVRLDEFIYKDNNPRVISYDQLEDLKSSISGFPKMMRLRPIVFIRTASKKEVIGGNQRLKALRSLGYTEIPEEWTKDATDLTPEEVERFLFTDNIPFGDWDEDLLKEYDPVKFKEWSLEFEFDDKDVFKGDGGKIKDDKDKIEPPKRSEDEIQVGDMIEIGAHKLFVGSSLEDSSWSAMMSKDQSFDLILTDPPYGVSYTGRTEESLTIQNDSIKNGDFYQFLLDYFTVTKNRTKKGASWYVFHADVEGHNFRTAFIDSGVSLKQCLIWNKQNAFVLGRSDYHWSHEPILYGWVEGQAHSWYSDRKQRTVLNFDRPMANREHPTMKPLDLLSYLINNSSKAGDLVSDGFLGSGSTMVAAHQTGRVCYGCELDPIYCRVIVNRMKNIDSTLEFKKNGEDWFP